MDTINHKLSVIFDLCFGSLIIIRNNHYIFGRVCDLLYLRGFEVSLMKYNATLYVLTKRVSEFKMIVDDNPAKL